MSYWLHNIVPPRWISVSHYNSRVWCCKNIYSNQTAMEQVVVGDYALLQKKKSAIQLAGPAKLQVIADFDATLTKYWIHGRRGQSSHGLLKQGNPEYDVKRQKLYEYYHPLEFCPTIPAEEKAKLMEEWWGKTHGLLIEGGLTYDAIKNSVASSMIAFREGVVELFEFLEVIWVEVQPMAKNCLTELNYSQKPCPTFPFPQYLAGCNSQPLQYFDLVTILFSSLQQVLHQKLHRSFKNVKIVSNRMEFDQNGHLVSFKGKTIHSLNKNEHGLDMALPIDDQLGEAGEPIDDNASVKQRTNVLLLGDHIGDLGMSDGLNYETQISVGFLNDNIESSLDSYRKAFDVVYLNDAPMLGVVKLVSQLCSTGSD